MTQFDDRERAAEAKFQLDQDQEFRAQARRAKLLGLWAAGHLGMSGEEADGYAKTVVISDLEEKGEEDLYRKVKADLEAKSVALSEHQVRSKMAELLDEARRQIKAGV